LSISATVSFKWPASSWGRTKRKYWDKIPYEAVYFERTPKARCL